ncbi:unnamed protein product [Amoebophrya sp. A25]|nr:unnamed protein product [Amoebophrya sp. A25]|eukprot:GSA25T00012543001.1
MDPLLSPVPQSTESFSPDRSPPLSPGDRASEVSHDDTFVPQKLKPEQIKGLINQSLGDVANQFEERTFPKPFRQRDKKQEINNYAGAGIIPCTLVDGKLHVLLQQPKHGKKSGVRWYDFGGKKKDNTELPVECACRKFTKYTYGLFSIETDWSSPSVMDELSEIYSRTTTWPLLLKSGTEWCKTWLLESDGIPFYNAGQSYHVYLMPVPFLAADVFCEVGATMDDSKREFQWVPHDIFMAGPLASRIHTRALFQQLTGLESTKLVANFSRVADRTRPNTFEVLSAG